MRRTGLWLETHDIIYNITLLILRLCNYFKNTQPQQIKGEIDKNNCVTFCLFHFNCLFFSQNRFVEWKNGKHCVEIKDKKCFIFLYRKRIQNEFY